MMTSYPLFLLPQWHLRLCLHLRRLHLRRLHLGCLHLRHLHQWHLLSQHTSKDSLLTLCGGPATCSVEVLMPSATSAALGVQPGCTATRKTADSHASLTQGAGLMMTSYPLFLLPQWHLRLCLHLRHLHQWHLLSQHTSKDSLLTPSGGTATCSMEVLMPSATNAALGAPPDINVMSTTASSPASPFQDVGLMMITIKLMMMMMITLKLMMITLKLMMITMMMMMIK